MPFFVPASHYAEFLYYFHVILLDCSQFFPETSHHNIKSTHNQRKCNLNIHFIVLAFTLALIALVLTAGAMDATGKENSANAHFLPKALHRQMPTPNSQTNQVTFGNLNKNSPLGNDNQMSGGSSQSLAKEIKQAVLQSHSVKECLDLVEHILMSMWNKAGIHSHNSMPEAQLYCQAKYTFECFPDFFFNSFSDNFSDSSSPTAPGFAKPKLQR